MKVRVKTSDEAGKPFKEGWFGFYGGKRLHPGDEFEIGNESELGSWMEPVAEKPKHQPKADHKSDHKSDHSKTGGGN